MAAGSARGGWTAGRGEERAAGGSARYRRRAPVPGSRRARKGRRGGVVPARPAGDELCLQPRVCLTLLFSFCVFQGGALSARGCRKGAPWASGKWELGRSMPGAVRSGVPARPRHLARQCPGRGPPGASLTLARHPRPAPVGSFGTGVAHRGRQGRAQALCCPLRLQSPLHGRSAAAGGRPGTNSVVTGRPHRGARRRRFQAAGVVVKVEPWGVLAAG